MVNLSGEGRREAVSIHIQGWMKVRVGEYVDGERGASGCSAAAFG